MILRMVNWKLGKGFCFAALFCLFASSTQADPDDTFELANNTFDKGEFSQAAKKYEALVEGGYFSKTLFFNLGTALYRSGSPGKGVLWFRRALVLDPGMVEVRQNMEFLRGKLGLLEFATSKKDRYLRHLSPALLRWLSSLGIWFTAFGLACLIFVRRFDRFRGLVISLTIFAILISCASIWATGYRAENLAIENFATIITANSKAVTAPVPGAKNVIDLPPGSEVKILQKSDHWTYVAIPGDLRGWIRSDHLEAIWPVPASPSSIK